MSDAYPEVSPKFLHEMQEEVDAFNESHGWKDVPRSFGDDIALLHSEVSEALDAYRNWGTEDVTRKECKALGVGSPEHLCKPEGVGSELADVLVRLLDTCARHGINLEAEFHRKMAYNRTRPYRHGGKRL